VQFPFRFKLIFWYSITVFLILAVTMVVIIHEIRGFLHSQMDAVMLEEADVVAGLLPQNPREPGESLQLSLAQQAQQTPNVWIVIDHKKKRYFQSSPILPALPVSFVDSSVSPAALREMDPDPSVRWLRRTEGEYEIHIAYAITPLEQFVNEMQAYLILIMMLGLIVTLAGGSWIMHQFLKPISYLGRYADEIVHEPLDLMQRLPVERKDEIGKLVEGINTVVQKMRLSVRQMLMFSSFASHELRTPLSVIRNQLENALRPEAKSIELRGVVASAYDEVLRLIHIVNEMLTLSRLQSGSFKIALQKFNFHKLMLDFHEDALPLARERNIELQFEAGAVVFLTGDEVRLRQVLFNLLDNALKYTPAGGHIRIRYHVTDFVMALTFEDTGIGIAQDELAKIFDPFYRGRSHREQKSTGLGLALVKLIVEAHRGSIDVTSEPDKGTTFTLCLPIRNKVVSAYEVEA